MKIVCETALVSVSSLEISGHVMHGENLECDQVLSAWHLIRHRPRERHPIGQTAAQYAPEHLTSRPFSGTGGLSPQSCHCLFDLFKDLICGKTVAPILTPEVIKGRFRIF